MSKPNSEPEKTQLKDNTDKESKTVEGWHDLFQSCPDIADEIFSHLNLEEIYQLCEVCSDWNQAVHDDSNKVQARLANIMLHKATVEGGQQSESWIEETTSMKELFLMEDATMIAMILVIMGC